MIYTPSNWYWKVLENPSQVYSSAKAAYIDLSDEDYQNWLLITDAEGLTNKPTVIDTEANLWNVLIQQYPAGISPINTTAQDQLKSYNITKLDIVAFKVLFNHENRIRALENKQPITTQQFINGIKALL